MGLGFLLGSGTGERIRTAGDLAILKFSKNHSVGQRPEGSSGNNFYGSILLGCDGSPGDPAVAPQLEYPGHESVSSRHAELFRTGQNLYIRDLDSRHGTWLWRNGRWMRVDPQRPALLMRGSVVAIGGHPGFLELSELFVRNEGFPYVVLHIEPAPEPDAVRLRQVRPTSLGYFLSGFAAHGSLFEERQASSPPRKTWDEVLGLAALSIYGNRQSRAFYHLHIAQRLAGQGHAEAALAEFAIAEDGLEAELQAFLMGAGPVPRRLHPKEVALRQGLGELLADRGHLLQSIQAPERAAVAFGAAAEQWRELIGNELAGKSLPNFQFELNASLAYRLYFQQAERAGREGHLIRAAKAYERAARYSEGARRYAELPAVQQHYPPLRIESGSRLLAKAAAAYLQAGPAWAQDYQRLLRELEAMRGGGEGPFR
ncbi:MAG: FHA domain-containing protein [bacterium]